MTRPDDIGRRKALGQFFTPPDLARWMASELFADWHAGLTSPPAPHLSLLDPACGDGALLKAAGNAWAQWPLPTAGTTSVAPPPRPLLQLFGVDRDASLAERCRQTLHEFHSPLVTSTVACGNSLTGPAWNDPAFPAQRVDMPADLPKRDASAADSALDWPATFPPVAQEGGFDFILGNPPYLRERGQQELFAELARSHLGLRWRQPRMDLAQYFLHRALDLLKPGGWLTFVVSGYWSRSASARPLVLRLLQETELVDWVTLGSRPLFSGVQGHHIVFRLRRRLQPQSLTEGLAQTTTLRMVTSSAPLDVAWPGAERQQVRTADLFGTDLFPELSLAFQAPAPRHREDAPRQPGGVLADEFDVRQGIAENPPRISRSLARTWPGLPPVGTGVFVLSTAELHDLQLTTIEQNFVRPYFRPNDIQRYHLQRDTPEWLLYLTPRTAPRLDELPAIARHLDRFRPLLSARREVQRGTIGWWHLHWPREEALFLQPRILGIQMGRTPRFALVHEPAFTGFSTHVIVPRRGANGRSLASLVALLNAQPGQTWLMARAKRRGVQLDLSGGLLRQFPLPARDAEIEIQLDQTLANATDKALPTLEPDIESLVSRWWG